MLIAIALYAAVVLAALFRWVLLGYWDVSTSLGDNSGVLGAFAYRILLGILLAVPKD